MTRLVGCVLAALVLSVGAARATPSELQGLVSADRPAGCSKYRSNCSAEKQSVRSGLKVAGRDGLSGGWSAFMALSNS